MKKPNYKDRAKMRKRLTIVVVGLSFIFFILTFRLSYIMIAKRQEYAARAEEQWTSEVKIDARRGRILDRNGKELAVSANVYRVDFDLNSIRSYLNQELTEKRIQQLNSIGINVDSSREKLTTDDIAPVIAKALDLENQKVKEKLETKLPSGADAGSATLIRRIEKDVADRVRELNISGVLVSPDTKRYYPNNNFLAHVLGSTNIDGQGLTGIELQYNSYLSGVPGMKIAELDRKNGELPYTISQFTPPVDGKDVTLTIDENIQFFAEKAAEQAYEDNKAKAVSILVMDPKTGEVLAMVNKPDFDPNSPYKGTESFEGANETEKLQKMWRNRLVNDTFEPGSIFKVVTAITGLEEGIVNANTDFSCAGGLHFGNRYIKCWRTQGHGAQKFPDIIQNSCNVGFMKLGEMIGKEKLCEYIDKFGFGKVSGIDLPGEAKGIVKKVDTISETDLATIAFGQTNTVNSVQYMTAFNAIANGGTLIQPHIMKEVTHNDNSGVKVVDDKFNPKNSQVASKEKTAELRSYLERVVTGGSGAGTFMEGYHIGGKTGTAQKVNNGTYGAGKYISSFVGMAPVDDPKVTVMVTVDEPSNGAYYAGQVCTPAAKMVFSDIFNYLDSKFSDENSSQISRDVVIPEVRGLKVDEAQKILKASKLDFVLEDSGDVVIDIKPYPGYAVKEGSKINLYTGNNGSYNKNVVMPDVRGYSKSDASKLLTSLGINITFDGDGIVTNQSVNQGEVITKGMSVKLTLNSDYKD
ncbi:stage V sporulation protein D [Clostridium weizhouense]|uniref:Stage V sporulation protein D n=1 Tax=Clostridium weizhouense TaxID=2859781 RepID=A0ABS7AR74_9CLOT|nr:stage V sporulation protein D [Clostridium weizhouense]MBW6410906.1 stage V sporulation protein D [Clostridium weizhouense]